MEGLVVLEMVATHLTARCRAARREGFTGDVDSDEALTLRNQPARAIALCAVGLCFPSEVGVVSEGILVVAIRLRRWGGVEDICEIRHPLPLLVVVDH